ncbi:terminase large subunit [Aliarcobacter lanthieri]|uniref:terminase large subunit n=1 Tax=Aliarcobacter lanthieri TaxID=1355374 RepID=UPI003AAD6AF5
MSINENQKLEIYSPKYYWDIAEKYIIKKDKELQKESDEYYIDKPLAYRCVRFGSLIKHTAGSFGGKTFQFQEWQIESVVDLFGTKHKKGAFKGLRRYQRALFFMPKKNGKTEFGALLHLIMFFLFDEKSKEQYCIGRTLDQAKLVHKAFTTMINQEDDLKELVHITKKPPKIIKKDGAFEDVFEALASDADSQEGKNVSFFTNDEPHTHPNKDTYQILADGMAGRDEPLEVNISTAGYNMQGYFFTDIYLYAKKVKQGIIKDDTFYCKMFELDEEDMKDDDFWKDEKLWKKANPNLGISPTYSYMRNKVILAEQSEQALIAFKTKHLNVWCDKVDIWIRHKVFSGNQTPIKYQKIKSLKNKLCYGGLDLSSSTDITSLVLNFPRGDGGYDVIPFFWIPKDNMRERVRRDKVPYFDWVKQGYIKTTTGNVIDYSFIERDIRRLAEFFNIKMIAYDRWNSSDLIRRLTDDEVSEFIPFGQGFASMSAPTKQIEVLSLQGKLNHGNNPVLNWMNSNVVLRKDPSGNIKIDKDKSTEKVDGMVAEAMALGVAIKDEIKEETNIYETRGLREL